MGEALRQHVTDGYGLHNYYMGTTAVFEPCPDPTSSPSFVSRSGSEYWYTGDGVIRRSNHWGTGIASCDWLLGADGRSSWDTTAPRNMRSGFCRFADFHPNGFYDVVVYGVDKDEANGEDVNGTPYKVIEITPDMLRDGYVITEYGKCNSTACRSCPSTSTGRSGRDSETPGLSTHQIGEESGACFIVSPDSPTGRYEGRGGIFLIIPDFQDFPRFPRYSRPCRPHIALNCIEAERVRRLPTP